MRSIASAVAVPVTIFLSVAVFGMACGRGPGDTPAPQQDVAPPQVAARCGGSGGFDVLGLTAVVSGTDNELLTASSRQFAHVKPGVEVKPEYDPSGTVVGVMLMANQSSGDFTCRCPDGCGGSCALVLDASDPTYIACEGDCTDGDVCCFGCGLFSN